MKQSNIALYLDLDQQYEAAIFAYEQALNEKEDEHVFLYIELAFLYWHSACDFSWSDHYNISINTRRMGMDRAEELINIAKVKFPNCGDLYFWEKYFLFCLLGHPLRESDILDIFKKYETTVIPFFFLYICHDEINNPYQKERDYLVNICQKQMTAKHIRILSLIEYRGFLQ